MRAAVALLPLALLSCQGQGVFEQVPPELTLAVEQPAYGDFVGDGPVVVSGTVSSPDAWVWVEGRRANVGSDGRFQVELPVLGAYRILDVLVMARE